MRRCVIAMLACGCATVASGTTAQAQWVNYAEPSFGARLSYPSHLFQPVRRAPDELGRRFRSGDGQALVALGTWRNSERESPRQLKAGLVRDPRYSNITYAPSGRNWFVLSGYRNGQVYYEKIMFSCGGEVVNALGISYPRDQRDRYDDAVERMEDSFRPGNICP